MARVWGLAMVLVGVLTMNLQVQATVLSGHIRVVAAPFEGHAGDAVYLSGSGFPAHRLLQVIVACPNLRLPSNGSTGYRAVRTDRHGQFVAYRILAPISLKTVQTRCAIYAGTGRSSMARVVPAPFLILPHSRPLARCAVHMCVGVTASLVRLRNETEGNIVISGWPGASARLTIVSAVGHRINRRVTLRWQGTATVRLRISLGLKKGVANHVYVTAKLGRVSGYVSAPFVVVPGGR